MAARFTVYCKRSVADVVPQELLAGIKNVDLYTIAECYDIADEIAADAIKQLRIENMEPEGFRWYRLSYRPSGLRQIEIERWQTAEVPGVVAEVLDDLKGSDAHGLHAVREHLAQTVDIVDASFGSSPGEQMALVFASEAARWLAEKFAGIIRSPEHTWWRLGPHQEYQPLWP